MLCNLSLVTPARPVRLVFKVLIFNELGFRNKFEMTLQRTFDTDPTKGD
jgi:hypothetical protein